MQFPRLHSLAVFIIGIEILVLFAMSIFIFRPLVRRSLKENSALADSEERYRNLVELSPDAVLLHSGGKIDYVNNSGVKFLGASDMNDLIGKPIMDFISPEQRELVKKRIEMSKRGEKLPCIEEKLFRLDGQSVYAEVSGSSFKYKGETVTQSILRDITARKETEGKLLQLEKAVETTQLGITITDVEGKILYINSAEAWQHGYEVEELIGKGVKMLAPPGLWKKITIEELSKMYNRNWESVNVKKDGTTFPVHLTTDIVRNESSVPVAIVTTCEDITDRKIVEKELSEAKQMAETATIAKSEFLASMSHEIRTPMTSIIGMAEFLSDSPLNDEQQKALRILSGASENLLALINDILDLSKVEAGHLELEEVEFKPEELLSEMESFMGVAARGKGLELSYHIEADIPVKFIGDPKRLRQIIFNLVSNAVKFTKKGRVDINVRRTGTKDDITELEFHVKDTGIGIPENKLDLIFERFTQADSSITRDFGGTGLGTAISKLLVEAMGGSICVESELGKGSTFCFTVKLKTAETAEDEKTIKKEGEKENPIPWERSLRILVVEDSEDNRNLILMHLKETPHIVDIVENGKVAVEKFQAANYDLVLTDMEMPVMDGYTATKKIRKWETKEKKRPTPIVALTAHALKEHEQKSIDAGCTGHLTKPFKKQELLEVIHEYANSSVET
jgi:PAS domain S-box-containing protein